MENEGEKKPYKSGFVSIVGRPNVGKSTLMNHLIGQKIAITSDKPQTTRNRIRTVYTSEEGQIVFVDTPGIHKSKNLLGDYMVKAAEGMIGDCDLILWITEPVTKPGKGELAIIEDLKTAKVPVLLVINKIDTVDRKTLMESIAALNEAFQAAEVIPVCAIRKENFDELLKCIFAYLPEGVPYYDEDTVTEEPVRHIAAEL
ncbi:MAG: GTPase Era, partial [Lachnospiraceae bacterium]|nr:GTPase Era [Lachnospiraceae bacterium]